MAKGKVDKDRFWADKIMDLANLAVIVLVFGQLVSDKMNVLGFTGGIVFYSGAIIITNYFLRK